MNEEEIAVHGNNTKTRSWLTVRRHHLIFDDWSSGSHDTPQARIREWRRCETLQDSFIQKKVEQEGSWRRARGRRWPLRMQANPGMATAEPRMLRRNKPPRLFLGSARATHCMRGACRMNFSARGSRKKSSKLTIRDMLCKTWGWADQRNLDDGDICCKPSLVLFFLTAAR